MNSVTCIDYETNPFFKIVAKMLNVTEVGALSVCHSRGGRRFIWYYGFENLIIPV